MATDDEYKLHQDSVAGEVVVMRERQALAERLLGQSVVFDWELPRTSLGQYMWHWSSQVAINRCPVAAPLGDLSWSRQGET
ncbi:Ff.00g039460.m01.CDS01 [Fusarium sp. VM40]|nr:Ff.00g039460.m01.CDS01 [Fusarium sp. VM40]